MIDHLFTPIELGGISLKNRLTMAPLYLGYAGAGGTVSPLLLEHYRMMADSGVGLVVVENATVDHPTGSGSDRTIRADTDANADGTGQTGGDHPRRRGEGLPPDQSRRPVCRGCFRAGGPVGGGNLWPDSQGPERGGDRGHHGPVRRRGPAGQSGRV